MVLSFLFKKHPHCFVLRNVSIFSLNVICHDYHQCNNFLKAKLYYIILYYIILHLSFQVTDLDDEAGSPTEEFKAFAGDSGMNRSQSEYCNVGSKTSLTNHPAKKYVFDFMRVLIMDNLCMTPASKQTPIIDLLLEVRR